MTQTKILVIKKFLAYHKEIQEKSQQQVMEVQQLQAEHIELYSTAKAHSISLINK